VTVVAFSTTDLKAMRVPEGEHVVSGSPQRAGTRSVVERLQQIGFGRYRLTKTVLERIASNGGNF
jgi:hypothetical protein